MAVKYLLGVVAVLTMAGFVLAEEKQNEPVQLTSKGISGIVLDSSGKAVMAVAVSLTAQDAAQPAAASTSDKDGAFQLSAVPEGMYRLDIGGRLTMNVRISERSTNGNLRVLYPDKDMKGAALPAWTPLAIGGAVVVTAVVVSAIAISESGDGVSQ